MKIQPFQHHERSGGIRFLAFLHFIVALMSSLPSVKAVNAFTFPPLMPMTEEKLNYYCSLTRSNGQKYSKSCVHGTYYYRRLLSSNYNNNNDNDDDDESPLENESTAEQRRMEMVRSLQKSFYAPDATTQDTIATATAKTTTSRTRPTKSKKSTTINTELQSQTGIVTNLPLWRVGWVEVPGRSSCLNVHEGQYTHMFETILSKPKPWYVGHLHLPGGFKMTRTDEEQYKLKNWSDELEDSNRFLEPSRSAVVGSLMEVSDYRRLQDGRLVIFVHVLERFVVDKVIQEFPYSVANVQILPDAEELPALGGDENFAKVYRASAVTESFKYHDYEYAKVKLPLANDQEYLDTQSIANDEIAKLLPFAYYSNDKTLLMEHNIAIEDELEENSNPSVSPSDETATYAESFSGGMPPLETQLLRGQILRNPKISNKDNTDVKDERSIDTIETLLWLALEEFSLYTEFALPEEVACLIPPSMIDYLTMSVSPSILISCPNYPKLRRQKRLSYTAAAFLENTEFGLNLRQNLLCIPSTKTRLAVLLERFEHLNDKIKFSKMGEFE